MSLVRAAWERRPEGPAYLLPSVTLLYLAGQCAFFGTHLPPLDPRNSEDFPEFLWFPDLSPPAVISTERDPTVQEVRFSKKCFPWRYRTSPLPRSKTFMFLGVAGGTIERSCYSPHYVNTERDYERDYQATLPQGRTAADGCKPRHGRDDRKRERSFSGLRGAWGARGGYKRLDLENRSR